MRERHDAETAKIYRKNHPDEIAHISDEDLLLRIQQTRAVFNDLGLRDKRLRARFMMLGVFRAPRFWEDPFVAKILMSAQGPAGCRQPVSRPSANAKAQNDAAPAPARYPAFTAPAKLAAAAATHST